MVAFRQRLVYANHVSREAVLPQPNPHELLVLFDPRGSSSFAVVIFSEGTVRFGRYPFAYLFSDTVFTLLVTGVFAGLILLGVAVGGELHL